jgi:hypothetical protein
MKFRWFTPVLLVAFLAGCGPSELPKNTTYPTTGKVLLHGEPAQFVIVHLEPTVPNHGVAAEGVTREDGTFQLRTYSNEEFDGAVPGEYSVTLEEYDPVRSVNIKPTSGITPTKVPNGEMKTKVVVEVKADTNDLQINVP